MEMNPRVTQKRILPNLLVCGEMLLLAKLHYSPVDEAKSECHMNEHAGCFCGAGIDPLGEITLVVVIVVVVGIIRRIRREQSKPCCKKGPDDKPPDYGEAFKNEQCDPVVDLFVGMN